MIPVYYLIFLLLHLWNVFNALGRLFIFIFSIHLFLLLARCLLGEYQKKLEHLGLGIASEAMRTMALNSTTTGNDLLR